MRKLAWLLGCLSLASNASETVQREMLCDNTTVIVKTLKETYHEIPVITGRVDDEVKSILTIWTNPSTDTWTIVATHKDYSCIIGTGEKLKVINYTKGNNI
jgi:hypothetical protein